MKPSEVKSIRLMTRVSKNEIDALGGRKNTLKLLKAIVRVKIENKQEIINKYEHQRANI
jgi:hypothetical protein